MAGCVLLAVVTFALMPSQMQPSFRILVAWNLATWLYVGLAARMMAKSTESSIRQHAVLTDESRFVILALAGLAAAASMAAIIAQLGAVKDAQGYEKALHLDLAVSTIVSAWVFIHLVFAQHYAHEFYIERVGTGALEPAGSGLSFPGTERPTFLDFVYNSFVIGCAAQTADVATTSRSMRVITLIHGVFSFFFNTTILALTINIASSLF